MTATVEGVRERMRCQDVSAPEPGQTLSIAETAERVGVTAHTLRYYERIGLLSIGRDAAGQRRYTAADFARVVFLNRLRMTGMPIRELCRYVELVNAGPDTGWSLAMTGSQFCRQLSTQALAGGLVLSLSNW
jgi:DNA-binding transcriptional MerR regulator